MRISRSVFVSGAAFLLFCCLAMPATSHAQAMDGISQLLGGGLLPHTSAPASAPVTVDRSAQPYKGSFSGKEATGAETKSLDAKFACYPAHDPAFDQTDTFVCYAAE
jgi:hypothetical protein